MDLMDFMARVNELGSKPTPREQSPAVALRKKPGRPKKPVPVTEPPRPTSSAIDTRVSPAQRAALGQTDNDVRAIYHKDARRTPLRRNNEGLTLNLGGSCESFNGYAHGRRAVGT